MIFAKSICSFLGPRCQTREYGICAASNFTRECESFVFSYNQKLYARLSKTINYKLFQRSENLGDCLLHTAATRQRERPSVSRAFAVANASQILCSSERLQPNFNASRAMPECRSSGSRAFANMRSASTKWSRCSSFSSRASPVFNSSV